MHIRRQNGQAVVVALLVAQHLRAEGGHLLVRARGPRGGWWQRLDHHSDRGTGCVDVLVKIDWRAARRRLQRRELVFGALLEVGEVDGPAHFEDIVPPLVGEFVDASRDLDWRPLARVHKSIGAWHPDCPFYFYSRFMDPRHHLTRSSLSCVPALSTAARSPSPRFAQPAPPYSCRCCVSDRVVGFANTGCRQARC
eukprot:Lithocolla_globosa_v1_NODE_6_length_11976_cov_15.425432.p8 type:complete len:196 gc:universal NODE_6_length_11976_cov_15.425432:10025-10612(+)